MCPSKTQIDRGNVAADVLAARLVKSQGNMKSLYYSQIRPLFHEQSRDDSAEKPLSLDHTIQPRMSRNSTGVSSRETKVWPSEKSVAGEPLTDISCKLLATGSWR